MLFIEEVDEEVLPPRIHQSLLAAGFLADLLAVTVKSSLVNIKDRLSSQPLHMSRATNATNNG